MKCAFCDDGATGSVAIDGRDVPVCAQDKKLLAGKVEQYERTQSPLAVEHERTPPPPVATRYERTARTLVAGDKEEAQFRRQLTAELMAAVGELRAALDAPVPVDNAIMLQAESVGVSAELRHAIRVRFISAVMDKLGKAVQERARGVRMMVEDELMGLMVLLDTKSVRLGQLGQVIHQAHTSTSFNKDTLVQELLGHGLKITWIEDAIKKATTTSVTDITVMRWGSGRKKKDKQQEVKEVTNGEQA